jgi:hypothetical protein
MGTFGTAAIVPYNAALNCAQIVKIRTDKEQCSLRNNVCIMFADCEKRIYDGTVRSLQARECLATRILFSDWKITDEQAPRALIIET